MTRNGIIESPFQRGSGPQDQAKVCLRPQGWQGCGWRSKPFFWQFEITPSRPPCYTCSLSHSQGKFTQSARYNSCVVHGGALFVSNLGTITRQRCRKVSLPESEQYLSSVTCRPKVSLIVKNLHLHLHKRCSGLIQPRLLRCPRRNAVCNGKGKILEPSRKSTFGLLNSHTSMKERFRQAGSACCR